MDIQEIWFLLLGCMLAGYAVLDGFDMGVGMLHLFGRTDLDRRHFLNSIGPIWDGNEVWLVVFGGALFAAFPHAYSTVLSGFYLPFMMLLFALIFRAVSIEFRSKSHSTLWRSLWDFGFFGSSLAASFVFGIAAGNALLGIPLNAEGDYTGGFRALLNPYALMAGAVVIAMFSMHGSIFLFLKLHPGPTRDMVKRMMWRTWAIFFLLYIGGTVWTVLRVPRAMANFDSHPWVAIGVFTSVLAILNIPRCIRQEKPFQAFVSSAGAIVSIVFLFCMALFPNLVTARNDENLSLTLHNSSSSPATLKMMFIIALIGMPFVFTYTAVVYWTFRGRVEIGEHSY
jgi:cytochrome d ubiquinol oxidase subunit II